MKGWLYITWLYITAVSFIRQLVEYFWKIWLIEYQLKWEATEIIHIHTDVCMSAYIAMNSYKHSAIRLWSKINSRGVVFLSTCSVLDSSLTKVCCFFLLFFFNVSLVQIWRFLLKCCYVFVITMFLKDMIHFIKWIH